VYTEDFHGYSRNPGYNPIVILGDKLEAKRTWGYPAPAPYRTVCIKPVFVRAG